MRTFAVTAFDGAGERVLGGAAFDPAQDGGSGGDQFAPDSFAPARRANKHMAKVIVLLMCWYIYQHMSRANS